MSIPGVASIGKDTIFILLATYNGATYLPGLLLSLQAQTCADWCLLVRDDGSLDTTVALVREAAQRDTRVRLLTDDRGHLGVTAAFEVLLYEAQVADASYFALCDQDDVWHPDKLAQLRLALGAIDPDGAEEPPALAYSDLVVVDKDLNPQASSYFRFTHAGVAWRRPGYWLLTQNLVPGCAMMGNRALLARSLPFPEEAIIHDWWLLMCAASMGRIAVVDRPLIQYRQHDHNTIGAESHARKIWRFVRTMPGECALKQRLYVASVAQDGALMRRLCVDRPQEAQWRACILAMRHGLLAASIPRRVWAVFSGPVRRVGLARNLLLLCIVLSMRADPYLLSENLRDDD
ncbi:MAG: glycosyltransferase family 2 protein [Halothiobacillus sp.]